VPKIRSRCIAASAIHARSQDPESPLAAKFIQVRCTPEKLLCDIAWPRGRDTAWSRCLAPLHFNSHSLFNSRLWLLGSRMATRRGRNALYAKTPHAILVLPFS
jgi:hypothetical protein